MMNQFDFYRFYISSGRKGDLLRAGINRDNIHSKRIGFARYGNRAYPRYLYEASVSFMDAPNATSQLVDDRIHELEEKYGMSVHAQYVARD